MNVSEMMMPSSPSVSFHLNKSGGDDDGGGGVDDNDEDEGNDDCQNDSSISSQICT